MNIIEQLKNDDQWKNNEKIITKFILEHRDSIITMSIQELSKETYTSTSTIFRICKKLGFSGFPDFKVKFAAELQKGTEEIKEQTNPDFPTSKNDSFYEVAKKIYSLSIDCLNITYKRLNQQDFIQATDLLMKSKKIALFAIGDNYARCISFMLKMNKIGIFPILDITNSGGFSIINALTKNDCALLISYSGETKYITKNANLLRANKIPFIGIGSDPNSTLGKLSTIFLQTVDNECTTVKNSTFASQGSIEFILNLLYTCCFQTDYDRFTKIRIVAEEANKANKTK